MTVLELKRLLQRIPDNAIVIVKHDLIGDEHSAEKIEYDGKTNIVYIRETF